MTTARRVPGCVLLAVLLLLASPHETLARQRPTCVTIREGETVAAVAQRITGDARNMRAAWFQVVNPTTSRWVPKARYDLRFAGWRACIMAQAPLNAPLLSGPLLSGAALTLAAAAPPPGPPVTAALPRSAGVPLTNVRFFRWGPLVAWCSIVLVFSLTYWLVDDYLVARADTRRAMKHYAERFVEEFERPLIQHHLAHRPIHSRVRFKPGRSRFDVLLAPQAGLRYPNLTDHKRNVMYDVVRIQQALSEHAFVSSRPYAKGRWVVVPFRFRETRKTGDT